MRYHIATPTMLITTYLRNGIKPSYSVNKIIEKDVSDYNNRIAKNSDSLILYNSKQIKEIDI